MALPPRIEALDAARRMCDVERATAYPRARRTRDVSALTVGSRGSRHPWRFGRSVVNLIPQRVSDGLCQALCGNLGAVGRGRVGRLLLIEQCLDRVRPVACQ